MGKRYTTVYRSRRRVNTGEDRRVCYIHESEVFASELERDERMSRKRAEETGLMLIEETPNRPRQPVGWICNAVREQGLVEYPQEPEDARRALNARAPAAS